MSTIRRFATFLSLFASFSLVATQVASQTYQVLHTFTGDDGAHLCSSLIADVDGQTLYGTSLLGGSSDRGTLFKINASGGGFTVLKHFAGGNDAGLPWGLVLAGNTLYGTTQTGGLGTAGGGGTIFKINTDGSGFTVIHAFEYRSSAFWPEAGMVLSGDTLYGTTGLSASPGYGTVFKIHTDGSGYELLKTLGNSDGANPCAELVLAGTILYGTTSGYAFGTPGATVFRINSDGTDFNVLRAISRNGNGNRLFSPVVLSGNTLFGTACEDNSFGMVFRMDVDGSNFTVIKAITNNFGSWGGPGVVGPVLSGKTLYATTGGSTALDWGDTNYCGTIFQVNTNGENCLTLKTFGWHDGAAPAATLLLSGATLYGTTYCGGDSNLGVVFSLSLPPMILAAPEPASQTVEAGDTVSFAADATSPLLNFQWYLNGTNAIPGATNFSLELTNVDGSWSGIHTVIITNPAGAITSAPVALAVVPRVDRRPVWAINLNGEAGSLLNVDFANSLSLAPDWFPLATVSLVGTSQLCFDISTPLPSQRFYRAWQTGVSTVLPALDFPRVVPALTLTGNPGNQIRVDGINQSGPTDAWFTLDTVTLTNTSQLYFDVTAAGQPARLYRLVPVP